jgi:DNA-binding transcriptional MerR regulator
MCGGRIQESIFGHLAKQRCATLVSGVGQFAAGPGICYGVKRMTDFQLNVRPIFHSIFRFRQGMLSLLAIQLRICCYMSKPKSFTAGDIHEILGIRQRTLDYWDQCNVVRPSVDAGKDKGQTRRYSFDDLRELTVVMRLRDTGLSLQKIRKALQYLREHGGRNFRDGVFITDGKDLFQKHRCGQLESVLRKGQMAFSVVFVGKIPDELEPAIRKLDAEKEERRRARLKNKTA